MKVILLTDVKDIGKKDDICNVSDGYARNFLFPRKWAMEANDNAIRVIERKREAERKLINTLPESLQSSIEKYFHPSGYEQKLVKGCDVYAAYLKCRLEIAGGNVIEFQDALEQITGTLEQIKGELHEIAILDEMFGECMGLSVDRLLKNGANQPAKSLAELQQLWIELGDTQVSECGQYLDEPFLNFVVGDDVHSVWHWFERQNPSFSVADAMYNNSLRNVHK